MLDITDLKRNVNLASLVEADLGPACKRNGRWLLWRCPFHQDHIPSLALTPDNGAWHCFGCGKSGDAITWVQERQGLDFRAACERLGALPPLPAPSIPRPATTEADLPPTEWQEKAQAIVDEAVPALWSDTGERARAWLHQRGLQDDSLRYWQIGYNPTDRKVAGLWLPRGIVIPCWQDGTLWEVKVRRAIGDPKYIAVKGSKAALFGAETLAGHQVAMLCEGMFDAMLLEQEAGDLVGVATSTAPMSTWRPSWTHYFLHCERVLVAYDTDQTGEEYAEKLLALIGRARRARVPIGKDITEYWQAGGNLRAWVCLHLTETAPVSQQAETMAREPSGSPWERVTLSWPADTQVPTIGGQWERIEDGRILATYTPDELALCLALMEEVKRATLVRHERHTARPPDVSAQDTA